MCPFAEYGQYSSSSNSRERSYKVKRSQVADGISGASTCPPTAEVGRILKLKIHTNRYRIFQLLA